MVRGKLDKAFHHHTMLDIPPLEPLPVSAPGFEDEQCASCEIPWVMNGWMIGPCH